MRVRLGNDLLATGGGFGGADSLGLTLSVRREALGRILSIRAGSSRGLGSVVRVVVHTFHVVEEVVAAREAIARNATLTTRIETQVRTVAVTMHAMSLSLMAEQTGGGRELLLGTALTSTAEGLDVGVDKFTGWGRCVRRGEEVEWGSDSVLVVALQLGGLVRAVRVLGLEWTVVQAVGRRTFLVEWMAPVTTLISLAGQAGNTAGSFPARLQRGLGLGGGARNFLGRNGRHDGSKSNIGVTFHKVPSGDGTIGVWPRESRGWSLILRVELDEGAEVLDGMLLDSGHPCSLAVELGELRLE